MKQAIRPPVKRLAICALCVYFAGVAVILFFRTDYVPSSTFFYWDYVRRNIQLIPLRTVGEMVALMINSEASYNARFFAALNITGNLLLMFPAGLLVPAVFQRFRKLRSYAVGMLVLITGAEILQVLTVRGSFDVDDILLNFAGAILGFLVFDRLGRLLRGRA